jgi:hypothetical protein
VNQSPRSRNRQAEEGTTIIQFGHCQLFTNVSVGIVASFTGKLDAYDGLTADEQRAISHGNAWTLFPRLVPKHHTARIAASTVTKFD